MLPSPATSGKRRSFRRVDIGPQRNFSKLLLSRSRFTNLGLILLTLLTLFSLYHNLRFWFSSYATNGDSCLPPKTVHGYSVKFGSALWATIPRPRTAELNHLVIVPGHAIWTGHDPKKRLDDSEWILEPYQKGRARLEALYHHIQRGVDIGREDDHALVVFSGGQTRLQSTMTEAQSYLRLALSSDPTYSSKDISARLTTEDYALDSFQNLLFSIARFKEYTGRYPERISVVGYEFKRARFETLHRKAIRWPEDKFEYYGVDPDDVEHVRIATEGERENGFLPYTKDLYGCHAGLLDKRQHRNPFRRFHSYYLSAPELSQLLDWCPSSQSGGKTTLFFEQLPWDHRT
ncbi:hypothetical protein P691DRAFT_693495 [Macrolepiota fuliginosa MF-IS2]|uniref:DUF218 domain-containing protein n=1 Tax=Macrolepiota fuliginosa MF-IS2 TaxID=1400762 RepID=A0A9P5XQM4_9AGAR|nr:hypothetical protein P691DRAFT_693495 [Macrolepiota fuliginosa MF-IS2]